MAARNREPERWSRKFALAARGLVKAVRSERSFRVHLAAALAVIAAAAVLRANLVEWCVLILCMAVVLAAELVNTALEHLGRAITPDENDNVRDALDVAAGAVLVVAMGAAVAGIVIFANRLAAFLGTGG
jgi:diacylglycerol kinase